MSSNKRESSNKKEIKSLPSHKHQSSSTPQPLNTQLKPIHASSHREKEDIKLMDSSSLQTPSKLVGHDFLTRNVLIRKLTNNAFDEEGNTFLIGKGVPELVSCATFQYLYSIITRLGKCAECKINPNENLDVTFVDSNTDKLRKQFLLPNEKKPKKNNAFDNNDSSKRNIRVAMKDVYNCRKFLPQASLNKYESRKNQKFHQN